jgi:cellulose synthase/poly-beta-1,6-N-acetylglucosamine synthase-like glycosyltransferase
MLTEIFIIIFLLYFLSHFILYFGLKRSLALKTSSPEDLPFVTIIVAAKNEENNISSCIESLKKINYKKDRFEVILVNDNSTDQTKNIMTTATNNLDNFNVIDSRKTESGNLIGKANAIDTAIEISKGELIFTTDADCEVSPDWINETIKYYDNNTGMVCGFTSIKHDRSLFEKAQALDWLYLLTIASSSAGFRKTMSCVGNNLSFRKEAYYKAGGYSSIDFSVTEDLAFMRKINDGKDFIVKYPVKRECIVRSNACKSVKEVFSQKRRWFRGGIGINAVGYWMGALLFISNFYLLTGFLYTDLKIYLTLIIIKIISEILLIIKPLKIFDLKSLLYYYPFFIIYFSLYGVLLPFTMIFYPKIKWKGRKY